MPQQDLFIPLSPRLPPITLEDLAQMLSIDLALGRYEDFSRRLRKALLTFAATQTAPTKNAPCPRKKAEASCKDLPLPCKGCMSNPSTFSQRG